MSEKIDATLKKFATNTPTGKPSPTSKPTGRGSRKTAQESQPTGSDFSNPPDLNRDLPGDPDCPICHGVGYVRQDLPVGHPEFGRIQICSCRNSQVSQRVRERLFTLSNLEKLSHLTFENFNPRGQVGLGPQGADSLELAYNQAHHFAQTLNGWLLLQGGFGCGKTHLAAAIANFVVGLGVPTLFITVPDLLDSLRFAYQDPEATFEERFNQIRQAPLLVMDDFGTQNATPWAQEKLFQILNYRYINRLPLVVTTNLAVEDLEGRIQSRLGDPELVTRVRILATDYRNPTRDIGHHQLSSLALFHDKTFASFELRQDEGLEPDEQKGLERALKEAQKFAAKPRGWIVFTGSFGSGKTHLAAAIGNYCAETGTPPIMVGVPDLLDYLRATFSPTSTISLDRQFEEIKTKPLLILDDLGTQSVTPWAREKLYQLFNYRYNATLPTVITTSAFKEEMDARILSRMEDSRLCKIFSITVPSFRGTLHRRTATKSKPTRGN
jgi:DNA replication protein DnaC